MMLLLTTQPQITYIVFYEGGENSGIFYNTDDDDDANLDVATTLKEDLLLHSIITIQHNHSWLQTISVQLIWMQASVGDAWNSGEALTVTLIDQDLNKNTGSDEDLAIKNTTKHI